VLEGATSKLGAVASNVLGVSGKAMRPAIVAGTTAAVALAIVAQGRLREKRDP
jgi:hypothetical protein